MAINLVVAIVRESTVRNVVSKLYANNVPGVSVSPVRGYGEHVNVYSGDLTDDSVRVEVFVAEKNTRQVVDIIMQAANTGMEGDGIVSVLPVNEIYQIRDFSQLTDSNLMLT